MTAMIIPGEQPLYANRNGVFSVSIPFGAQTLNLSAARMQLRTGPGATGSPLLEINSTTPTSNGSKITIVDAVNWIVTLLIANADLAALPAGIPTAAFAYDLVLTDSSGAYNPWLAGVFILREGVTR